MLKSIQRFLIITLLLCGSLYLLYEGFLYYRALDKMPVGTTIGGVEVSGLTGPETADLLLETFYTPVGVYYQDTRVEITPQSIAFTLDVEGMVKQAEALRDATDVWEGYGQYLIGRSLTPITIDLLASHDPAALAYQLETMATFMDVAAEGPKLLGTTGEIEAGSPGYYADLEASLPLVEAAFYHPTERTASVIVIDEPAPEWSIEVLEELLAKQLAAFDGVGSIFVLDLQTGQEVSINGDAALSGLSVMKIAIFVEAYRKIEGGANDYEAGLFFETAVQSSNYAANLLLNVAAGEPNTYRGADVFTESMQRMGFENTFIAVPYDAIAPSTRPNTYETPANQEVDYPIDSSMQTTAEEIGTLLSWIYWCADGKGPLLTIYPDELTADECQAIIDVLILNVEGNLIRFGVPDGVPVSHKHGWSVNEHADAGIVFSPEGDYVIVTYLAQPFSDWLVPDYSFPILREMSRATYNYFNFNDPYIGNALFEAERFDPDDPFFNQDNNEEGDEAAPIESEEALDEETAEPTPAGDNAGN